MQTKRVSPYVQVAPLALVLFLFVIVPLALVSVVSVYRYQVLVGLVPDFTLANYADVLTSAVNLDLYLSTLKFTVIVLAITLLLGFWISYFLVFHVRSLLVAIGLFLVCTVPFWTSNIIRMISWIPFLGLNGIFNQSLIALGIVDHPLTFLLFSDFAVVTAYVHLFTLFMIVPIFNSMARIDPAIIEAARDGGASGFRILTTIVVPLSKTGIALGSIFVIALVMGDFFVVKIMSGGQSGNVVFAMSNDLQFLNYPRAAANSVVLLIIVLLIATAILRLVDVRKELTG
jgi:putative spermidine/putrescine transport system permease protein